MTKKSEEREAAEFKAWRLKALDRVENALAKALPAAGKNFRLAGEAPPEPHKLYEAMTYALLGGGKRLRPLLALAAAEAAGGRQREALPFALAVEMIHAYSLIHDDLPCMDDDDLRRGRPTCHKVYGEAAALLAGDALQTLAFETLARSGLKSPEAARRVNQAALILASAAGASGMAGGQALDLAFENMDDVDIDQARAMESRKTGELITAALLGGATLAGGGPAHLKTLKSLGRLSGLAFQIKDDLLNLTGDPQTMGKAVGSDAARGKSSLPALLGREGAEAELAALTRKALELASSFKLPGRPLVFLTQLMVHRDR